MKTYLSILSLLILAACGPTGHLSKKGMTAESAERDTQACWYEVKKATAGMSYDDPIGHGLRTAELHDDCMHQRGYVDVP